MPRSRRLGDGSILRLHKYPNGHEQLHLKDGIVTLQFPTTEEVGREYLLKKFYGIATRKDFERMVSVYRRNRQIS